MTDDLYKLTAKSILILKYENVRNRQKNTLCMSTMHVHLQAWWPFCHESHDFQLLYPVHYSVGNRFWICSKIGIYSGDLLQLKNHRHPLTATVKKINSWILSSHTGNISKNCPSLIYKHWKSAFTILVVSMKKKIKLWYGSFVHFGFLLQYSKNKMCSVGHPIMKGILNVQKHFPFIKYLRRIVS